MAKCKIIRALEQDKIKFFLSHIILDQLLNIVDIDTNTMLKKNMFLQYLFCDRVYMLQQGFEGKLGAVMRTAISCFAPVYLFEDRNHIEIRISEAIEICVRDEEANKKELKELWAELQQMGLDYLADFCKFLLEPSFEKYQRLYGLLDKQEEYLRNRYKSILQEYVEDVVFGSEKEFNKWVSMREEEYKKIVKGDVKELQFREMKVKFIYFIHSNRIKDELTESYNICFEELCRLNKQFFEVYNFVVEVYVKHMQQVSEMSEKTAKCIINFIYEANRRKYYRRHLFEVIGILLASKYKKKLWEKVSDFTLAEQMIQQELIQHTEINWFVGCVGEEEQQNIISNIVNKITYDEKENSYISIIPLLIRSKIDLRNCISENDMKKLGQIECVINTNILSMKLLQMCMIKNDDPHKLIEEILAINMPRKAIFMELENMLRYCRVDNKEKIWVVTYQKLEDENFEGCQKIRDRIINDMMEAKCNAVTR